MKNQVKASAFIQWYMDEDTTETITKRMVEDLITRGISSVNVRQLFDECGYIPMGICDHKVTDQQFVLTGFYDEIEYDPSEVEFIDDITKPIDKTQEAREELHKHGYQSDNLWHVDDVTARFNCTEQQSHEVLAKALTNEWVIEQIHFIIGLTAEAMGLTKKKNG